MPRTSKCKYCKTEFVKTSPMNPYCRPLCQRQAEAQRKREKVAKVKVQKEKVKKKKSERTSVLKKKLWEIVSLYIRLRDSDDENFCTCCAC